MKKSFQYVALLRGIMPMNPNMRSARLKEAFEQMGFSSVRTVIASGNVVFTSPEEDVAKLEARIEIGLPRLLDFSSSTIVWSQEQVVSLLGKNPFAKSNGGKPNVTFFQKNHQMLQNCQKVPSFFDPMV